MNIAVYLEGFHFNETRERYFSKNYIKLFKHKYPEANFYFLAKKESLKAYIENENNKINISSSKFSNLIGQSEIVKIINQKQIDLFIAMFSFIPNDITSLKIKTYLVVQSQFLFDEIRNSKFSFDNKNKNILNSFKSANKIYCSSDNIKEKIIQLDNTLSIKTKTLYPIDFEYINLNKPIKQHIYLDEYVLMELSENISESMLILYSISDAKSINLIIINRHNFDTSEILTYIKRENLNDRVKIIDNPNKDYLKEIYNSAKIFVQPYSKLDFPDELIFALKNLSCVLCADYNYYTEFAGVNSWYFEPMNSSELKLLLIELWNSPETTTEIARRNLKLANKFDVKMIIENI